MPSEKLVWMPLYIRDIWADTTRLNATQYGAYMSLIENEFLNGPLPNDLGVLCQIARLYVNQDAPLADPENRHAQSIPSSSAGSSVQAWREHVILGLLDEYFDLGPDDRWRQKRTEYERSKALNSMRVNSERAKIAARARWKNHAPSIPPGSPSGKPPGSSRSNASGYAKFTGSTEAKTGSLRSPSGRSAAPAPGGGSPPPGPAGIADATRQGPAASHPSPAKSVSKAKRAIPAPVALHSHSGRATPPTNGKVRSGGQSKNIAPGANKRVRPSDVPTAGHPHFSLFRDEVFKFWNEVTAGVSPSPGSCPWLGSDAGALSDMLRASPDLDIDGLRTCLMHRAQSDIVPTDPPRNWLRDLVKFAAGPLDRYKHPLRSPRAI